MSKKLHQVPNRTEQDGICHFKLWAVGTQGIICAKLLTVPYMINGPRFNTSGIKHNTFFYCHWRPSRPGIRAGVIYTCIYKPVISPNTNRFLTVYSSSLWQSINNPFATASRSFEVNPMILFHMVYNRSDFSLCNS